LRNLKELDSDGNVRQRRFRSATPRAWPTNARLMAYQSPRRNHRNLMALLIFAVPPIAGSGTTALFLFRLFCRWFCYAHGNHSRRSADPGDLSGNMRRVIHVGRPKCCEDGVGQDGTISLFLSISGLQQAVCRNSRVGATLQYVAVQIQESQPLEGHADGIAKCRG